MQTWMSTVNQTVVCPLSPLVLQASQVVPLIFLYIYNFLSPSKNTIKKFSPRQPTFPSYLLPPCKRATCLTLPPRFALLLPSSQTHVHFQSLLFVIFHPNSPFSSPLFSNFPPPQISALTSILNPNHACASHCHGTWTSVALSW